MIELKNLANKAVTVTQVRSESKLTQRQRATLVGLGLRGINSSFKLKATEPVIGMIKKVAHVVQVEVA